MVLVVLGDSQKVEIFDRRQIGDRSFGPLGPRRGSLGSAPPLPEPLRRTSPQRIDRFCQWSGLAQIHGKTGPQIEVLALFVKFVITEQCAYGRQSHCQVAE